MREKNGLESEMIIALFFSVSPPLNLKAECAKLKGQFYGFNPVKLIRLTMIIMCYHCYAASLTSFPARLLFVQLDFYFLFLKK